MLRVRATCGVFSDDDLPESRSKWVDVEVEQISLKRSGCVTLRREDCSGFLPSITDSARMYLKNRELLLTHLQLGLQPLQ